MTQSTSRNMRTVQPASRRGSAHDDVVLKSHGAEDIANILKALKGDSHYVLLTTRINRFFDDTETMLTKMDRALAKLDFASFEDEVDRLRQDTSVMGAVAMMKLCYQLQLLSRMKAASEMEERLNQLRQEFALVKSGLIREA